MNCRVCGNPFFSGRTVFSCSCGSMIHTQCWEKHIVESHKPPFSTGAITIRGEFVPMIAETEQGSYLTEKEPVVIGRVERVK